MITAKELKEFRKSRDWTLVRLGEMVGYAESTMCKYENGDLPIPQRLNNIIYLMNTVEKMKKQGD